MATIENNVLIRAKDSSDNDQLFYPVTKLENVNGLQSALDGKAASSHGTHVSYSTTAPLVAGTADVGTAETVARSDHVHPAQIDVSGNAGTASKWETARYINGIAIQGDANRTNYGDCREMDRVAAKTVYCPGFADVTGAEITVKFVYGNIAKNPTLSVNETHARPIYYHGAPIPETYIGRNSTYTFRFNGSNYELVGDIYKTNYGICSTEAATAAKTVDCAGFALATGAEITVKFTATNTAENPTLNVGSTGAMPIYYRGAPIPSGGLAANSTYTFRFDGTNYDVIGDLDTNDTYPAAGSSLGLVKDGGDVRIRDGVITVNDYSHAHNIRDVNNLQTVLDDKAKKSHGTHVTFSTSDPIVAGTADVGTAETVARSDHVHPAQTSVSGNAGTASKWETARNINGMTVQGDANRTNYGICSSMASSPYKIVNCPGFELVTGAEITVKFTNGNTAENPTINANNTGSRKMYYRGAPIPSNGLAANSTYTFRFDGTNYDVVGYIDINGT